MFFQQELQLMVVGIEASRSEPSHTNTPLNMKTPNILHLRHYPSTRGAEDVNSHYLVRSVHGSCKVTKSIDRIII